MFSSRKHITAKPGVLFLAFALAASLLLTACGGNTTPGGETTAPTSNNTAAYTVEVVDQSGAPLSGIQVYLYSDAALADLKDFGRTGQDGKVQFTCEAGEGYTVVLKGVAAQYQVSESYPLTGTTTKITLTGSASTEPSGSDSTSPTTTDPTVSTEPTAATEPTVPPVTTNPTEPKPTEPKPTEPKPTEPKPTEPKPTQPKPTEPKPTQPKPTEPKPTQPKPTEPKPTQPKPTEPKPTEPKPTQPKPTEPKPTEPKPTEPKPTEPQPTEPVEGSKKNPIATSIPFNAEVKVGEILYYNVYRLTESVTIQIKSANAYVIYDGKTYSPKNGIVSVPVSADTRTNHITLAIGNSGGADASFYVDALYPEGSSSNPYKMELGKFTVHQGGGSEQGVFYTYTAAKSGTLILRLVGVDPKLDCDIRLTNNNTYASRSMSYGEGPDKDSVAVAVNAGDTVSVNIFAFKGFKYPAAEITVSAEVQ